ncbi:MYXO-CTERM sorting domain-containing protein, partial [Pyxidicoccus sp. 3LG]
PVETVWRLADGDAGVPVDFTVLDVVGNPVSLESPVVSGQLRVEASGCTRASLSLTARNRIETVAAGVQESAEAVVRIDAAPAVEDFSTATLNLTSGAPGAGVVEVATGTSLRCPGEGLRARLALVEGGTEVDSDDAVSVPGTWRPTLPEACAPGGYLVRGQLFDDSSGAPVAGDVEELGVPDTRPVGLGPLQEGAALVARCGEGATGTLTQTIPAGTCGAGAYSWESAGGPALAEGTLSGQSVTVTTLETGLEGLVGESLLLSVTANAGDGRTATTQHAVPITAEPFVELSHETDSPTTSETGLVGVVVRLRNTTECGVQTLRHVEYVNGLELVPGSVKLDGQPVTEQPVEGGFAVDGISLEPNATRALTYVARPRLFASPRFGGEVTLNRVVVSGAVPPAPADSGCGCSGGGSGAALFGLLTLAGLLRRRRGGAAE